MKETQKYFIGLLFYVEKIKNNEPNFKKWDDGKWEVPFLFKNKKPDLKKIVPSNIQINKIGVYVDKNDCLKFVHHNYFMGENGVITIKIPDFETKKLNSKIGNYIVKNLNDMRIPKKFYDVDDVNRIDIVLPTKNNWVDWDYIKYGNKKEVELERIKNRLNYRER